MMPSSPHTVAPVEVAQLFLGRSYSGSPERGSKSLRTTQRGRGATGPTSRLWAPSPSLSAVSFLTPPRARAFLSPRPCSQPPAYVLGRQGAARPFVGPLVTHAFPAETELKIAPSILASVPTSPACHAHLCVSSLLAPVREKTGTKLPLPLPVSNPSRHAPLLRLLWQHPRFCLSRR